MTEFDPTSPLRRALDVAALYVPWAAYSHVAQVAAEGAGVGAGGPTADQRGEVAVSLHMAGVTEARSVDLVLAILMPPAGPVAPAIGDRCRATCLSFGVGVEADERDE